MSLIDRINDLAARVGQEIKDVRGTGGSGTQQVFVQPAQPVVAQGVSYIWFQTGLGDGSDMTMWIEDGQ